MKKLLIALSGIFLLFFCATVVFAHSGKTDYAGGHYDNSSGKYHYHHGYPEHSHKDVDGDGVEDCPYDFDDKTDHSSGGSGNTGADDYEEFHDTSDSVDSNAVVYERILNYKFYAPLDKVFLLFVLLTPVAWAVVWWLILVPVCRKYNLDELEELGWGKSFAIMLALGILYVLFLALLETIVIGEPAERWGILLFVGICAFGAAPFVLRRHK